MKIMGVTLNKDGTPRKIGSGKTKGAGCYESVLLRDLRKFLNEEDEVSVSRVWLRNAKANQRGNTISLDLKIANQPRSVPTPTPSVKETKSNAGTKEKVLPSPPPEDEEEYAPPLFASDVDLRNY